MRDNWIDRLRHSIVALFEQGSGRDWLRRHRVLVIVVAAVASWILFLALGWFLISLIGRILQG